MVSSLNAAVDDNSSVTNVELVVTVDDLMSSSSDNDSTTNISGVVNKRNDDADQCMWFHFVVNTVLIGALCMLGLFGNTLSLLVLQRDRRNRVAVFLLQSLATADNLVLCAALVELSLVYGLLPVVGRVDIQKATAPYLIKYVNPVGYMVQSCAIWITVVLAVNRYVAICRPFVAARWLGMRRTRLKVTLAVVLSIALNIPRFFIVYITSTDTDDAQSNVTSSHHYGYNYTPLGRSFYFKVIYLNVFYTSFILILPLVLVSTLNVLVIRSLQQSKHRLRLNSLETYEGRSETNITIVMITIVIVLVLCHTPDRVLQVTVAMLSYRYARGALRCPHAIGYAYDISNMLIIISSSTNFIIYFFIRPNFRAGLRDRLTCVESHHDDDQSFHLHTPWHVEPDRAAAGKKVQLTSVADRNNHISLPPAAVVRRPLLSAPPRKTSTV